MTKPSTRLPWLLILVPALLLLGYWGSKESPEAMVEPVAIESSDLDSNQAAIPEATPVEEASPAAGVQAVDESETLQPNERVPVASPPPSLLSGRILGMGDKPLAGAEVTWTSWDPEFVPFVTSSVEIPAGLVAARTLSTRSNGAGDYGFSELPPQSEDQPSFLWVTHPGYKARSVSLEAGSLELAEGGSLKLEAATTAVVVVHAGDLSTQGARVYQQGGYPQGTLSFWKLGESAPKDRLLFLRSYPVETSSPTAIAPFGERQKIWAEHGDLCSSAWYGRVTKPVHLELFPSFPLHGVVNFPSEYPERWSIEGWGTSHVRVTTIRGPLREEVEVIPVLDDGSFGPVNLPLREGCQWVAILEGSLFVPTQQSFKPRAANEEVYLELDAEVGHVLWFAPVDAVDNSLIATAVVHGRWEQAGQQFEAEFVGREDGFVTALGIPPGSFNGTVTAEGYGTKEIATLRVPEASFRAIEIPLSKLPTLRGTCLAGLMPLSDFEIRFWSPSDPTARSRLQVIGSKNGEFVLEHLPGWEVSLCAISPEYGRSKTVTVNVGAASSGDVTLVVGPPGAMHGRLIDAKTGEPISGGVVEVFVSQGLGELDPIGTPALASSDGGFRVARLTWGVNVVSFNAPGYSARELKVWYEGDDADLGNIELSGQQTLSAMLLVPDGVDPTEYYLTADGIGAIAATSFDAEGELSIEAADAGAFHFSVRSQVTAGSYMAGRNAWLKHGETWELFFDLSGGHSLTVIPKGDGTPTMNGFAHITYLDLDGNETAQASSLEQDGNARLRGLGPGPVLIRVSLFGESDLTGLAIVTVDEDSPPELVVEVPLERNLTLFRILNSKGDLMGSTRVEVYSVEMPGQALATATTNGEGVCAALGLPASANLVRLTSSEGAVSSLLSFELPTEPGEYVEVVFDAEASIHLRLTDEGQPQALVTCRLWSLASGQCLVPGRNPDAEGKLILSGLTPDTYELRLSGFGYWPAALEVEAVKGGRHYEVEARRVGDLSLRFTSTGGATLANQEVAMEFLPTGETLQGWVAAGKLGGFDGGVRTDSSGKLDLIGLPHGTYRWSCAGGSGEVAVEVGKLENVSLLVP